MAGKRVRRRLWLWTPAVAYMAAIFFLSSQSQPLPALTEHVWDKLLHSAEYLGLALLLFRALSGEGLGPWTSAALTVALVSAYGASDEWHQMFVPLRTADVQDWMTDTLAGIVGAAACLAYRRAGAGTDRKEVAPPVRP
jgi:VanZ family protein